MARKFIEQTIYPMLFLIVGSLSTTADDNNPDRLREQALELRKLAKELKRRGTRSQQEIAGHFEEQSKLLKREAEFRTKHAEATKSAKQHLANGKVEDAKQLELKAAEALAHAEQERAIRIEAERFRSEQTRFREKLKQLNARAESLRDEGRYREADKEIRLSTRDRDPELQRANELKRRIVTLRLDGQHADANLFEREADRLLESVKRRYHYHPEIDHQVNQLLMQAERLEVEGKRDEATRLLEQAEATRHQLHKELHEGESNHSEVQQLRQEVRELREVVRQLTEVVRELGGQIKK